MVVFGKSGCIRGKVIIIGQKWLYSGKNGSILAKKVVFGQGGCILAKWLYLGKSGFCSCKSDCIRAKWLY